MAVSLRRSIHTSTTTLLYGCCCCWCWCRVVSHLVHRRCRSTAQIHPQTIDDNRNNLNDAVRKYLVLSATVGRPTKFVRCAAALDRHRNACFRRRMYTECMIFCHALYQLRLYWRRRGEGGPSLQRLQRVTNFNKFSELEKKSPPGKAVKSCKIRPIYLADGSSMQCHKTMTVLTGNDKPCAIDITAPACSNRPRRSQQAHE